MIREKESDIQNTICEYLVLKGFFFWRQNTTPTVQVQSDGKWQFRKMGKYAMKGIPDIIIIKDGKFIGLEVKAKDGIISDVQYEFKKRCEENNAQYYVVRSLEDVINLKL